MGNCKNCKFWDTTYSLNIVEDSYVKGNAGECKRMLPYENGGMAEASKISEGCYAELYTNENFGCVLFEQK